MNHIVDFIIGASGYLLIWIAVDIGRREDEKIIFMSRNWWVAILLISLGSIIVHSAWQ